VVAVLSMSKQEFSRLEVLLRVQSGHLRVSAACALIGLKRRQVFRLLRGLKQEGAISLVSERGGRCINHRLPAEVRALALSLVREQCADFAPTPPPSRGQALAAEKPPEHHGCSVGTRDRARLDDLRWALAGPTAWATICPPTF
jgi:Winged helix-turn helix